MTTPAASTTSISTSDPGAASWPWVLGWGVWALALARCLSEGLYLAALFSSPLAVAGVALGGAALALAVERSVPPSVRARLACAWPALFLPLIYVLSPRAGPLMGAALLAGGLGLALLLALRGGLLAPDRGASIRGGRVWPLAVLAVTVLGLYLRTMGRTVGEADTFEFQVVAPALGVAHPTGYPLYILLGKLFSLLPLGSVAWRVNLTSAVCATGAALLLYLLLERLTRQPLVACLSALALAFTRVLWSQAVVAEVYALNLLFVCAVLLLLTTLLEWRRAGAPGDLGRERAPKGTLWTLALLLGLSLTNHLTMALWLPAAGLALLLTRPRMGGRGWAAAAGLFLAGLLVYAYIPLRWPALHDGRWMSAAEFLAYVTGRQFGAALQLGLLRDPTRYAILGRLLLEPFGWAGLALAAAGLVWLLLRRPRLAVLSALTFLLYALYGLIYLVPDISVFLLPTHLLLALWAGFGVAALARLALRLRGWVPGLLIVLFALVPLSRVWLNLHAVDQSGAFERERWGRYVLTLPLAPDAAVLADGEKFAPLYYLQQIEGRRPDLDLAVHFTEDEYRADLGARLEAGQTVYLARYLPHLEGYRLRSLGPLVEVGTAPLAQPPAWAMPAEVRFGDRVELLAFDLQPDPQGGPGYHLTLFWRASVRPQDDLAVRLRLVGSDGRELWASEGSRPVGGNYPTNAWPPGAVVPDYHVLSPPAWVTPGEARLEVGLFPRFSDAGLPVGDGTDVWASLAQLEVRPADRPEPVPREARFHLGEVWLTGADWPDEVGAGSPVAVDLAWSGVVGARQGRLEWLDESEHVVGALEFTLTAGTVRSRHVVTAPVVPGAHSLRVALAEGAARCGWLARQTAGCDLGAVQVLVAPEGMADFGRSIALARAQAGTETLRPGEVLPVVLRWRAMRAMEENYTVTVQLLGPDGRLYGQVDSWPVQGTLPTSGWEPAQEIVDPYTVPLAVDAPPGRYQVIVGWYLLETMARLPVFDASGQAVADHAVVAEVTVTER